MLSTVVRQILDSVDQTQLHVQMMEHLSLVLQHAPVSAFNFPHVFFRNREASLIYHLTTSSSILIDVIFILQ